MFITSCTIEYALYVFEWILSWKCLIDTLFVQFISDKLFQFFDYRFDGATLVIPVDDTANMFVLQLTLNKGVEEIFLGTNSMNKEIEICVEIEFHFVVELLSLLVNENIFGVNFCVLCEVNFIKAIHLTGRHWFFYFFSLFTTPCSSWGIAHLLLFVYSHFIVSITTTTIIVAIHFFIGWLSTFHSLPAFLLFLLLFLLLSQTSEEDLISASFVSLCYFWSHLLCYEVIHKS